MNPADARWVNSLGATADPPKVLTLVASAVTPAPAILELDDCSLARLEPDDAPLAVELLAQRGNRYVHDLPSDEAALRTAIAELPRQTYALPLAILRGKDVVGMASTVLGNPRTLNASLLAMFVDPPGSTSHLALYLRHVFWNFPLHRLYLHVPDMDLTREYIDLYMSVGFCDEGRLTQHEMIGGQPFDMAVLGLLRPDFQAWCTAHEPRLSLQT